MRNAKEMTSAVTEMLTSVVSRSSRTWLCFILSDVIAGFSKMKFPVSWNLEIHLTIFAPSKILALGQKLEETSLRFAFYFIDRRRKKNRPSPRFLFSLAEDVNKRETV